MIPHLNGVETLLGAISFHMPPLSIQDNEQRDKIAQESNAEKDRVKVSKSFWPETLIKPFQRHYAQWGSQVKGKGFQYSGNLYEYNLAMVEEIENGINKRESATLEWMKKQWIEDYPSLRELAKSQMGSLYSDDQFPSLETVKAKLRYTWDKYAVPQGDYFRKLKGLSPQAAADLEKQQEIRYQQHKADSLEDAWKQLIAPLSSLLGSVTKVDDGTRTRFCEDIVERIKVIATVVPKKLIVSSPDIAKAAQDILNLAETINVEKLKNSLYARSEFKSQVGSIASSFGRKI